MRESWPKFIDLSHYQWIKADKVNAMIAGDVDAVGHVVVALHNHDRGKLVAWAFQHKLPKLVLQSLLADAWGHDHQHVMAAARGIRQVLSWFRQAEFPVDHLPESFPVWRGTSHSTLAQARRGLSWTLDKTVACWFALRYARDSDVLVLRREITRDQVLFHWTERDEAEVVIAPGGGDIDGDVGEWLWLFRQEELKRAAQWSKILTELEMASC
jgi:hypothetical protein